MGLPHTTWNEVQARKFGGSREKTLSHLCAPKMGELLPRLVPAVLGLILKFNFELENNPK